VKAEKNVIDLLINKIIVMATVIKYAVGLDIAKNKFDACLAVIDDTQKVKIKSSKSSLPNSTNGFNELLQWIAKHFKDDAPKIFCMEATGIYYEQLAWFLYQHGYPVSVLVPHKARNYMRSLGLKSKDDKMDAMGLATMAAQQSLKEWKPLSNQIYELRQLTRFHEQLQESRTIARNQLQTMICGRLKNQQVEDGLNKLIATIEEQIHETEKAIEILVHQDPVLWAKIENIQTVKGLGLMSIATVIAETDGFLLFENQAQLVSYCGYDVVSNQSGKRVGKTKISKMGNSHIRRILFMPAFSVVRYKVGPFADLYQRVYERSGTKMKGYTAVQRKLLILIYTLWKRNEKFKPDLYPEKEARLSSFCKDKKKVALAVPELH
jgi:transposase